MTWHILDPGSNVHTVAYGARAHKYETFDPWNIGRTDSMDNVMHRRGRHLWSAVSFRTSRSPLYSLLTRIYVRLAIAEFASRAVVLCIVRARYLNWPSAVLDFTSLATEVDQQIVSSLHTCCSEVTGERAHTSVRYIVQHGSIHSICAGRRPREA